MKMKTRALWAGWLLGTVFTALLSTAQSAPQEDFRRAFESATPIAQSPKIDGAVLAGLQARGLSMAPTCSDAVFVRRAYLDVIGTLPEIAETEAFLADTRADKRALLVEHLLARPEFADYWSMKWCDLLRVKAEFPINLWPNAVQYYHRWIREALRQNMPYDAFARALLSSSGSNFRVPQVNFYRALQGRSPEAIAATVALTFMGVRLETWPENQRKAMEAFFSRIAYKKTGEWKEEIVCLDPAPAPAMETTFPSGDAVTIGPEDDPRAVFAQWLIKADNSWFTANICNRIWTWLMGRGIVHEPDDFRHDNPPSNPELLRVLQSELLAAQYDLRHLFRLILNSATYQQSSIPETDSPEARALFAFYPVRRLEAEVLLDAINQLTGGRDRYSSPIPEPFTYIPETQRAIALADGSITGPFLEMFGRPPRDSGLESERNNQSTDGQRLYLLNASELHQKIKRGKRVNEILKGKRDNPVEVIRTAYLHVLSRYPTEAEQTTVEAHAYFVAEDAQKAMEDLVWALINSKEFLHRH